MKKLTQEHKIARYSIQHKVRSITKLVKDLHVETEDRVMAILRKFRRQGIINYQIVGRKIAFSCTRETYNNRSLYV
jgi:hypothetical protein